MKIIFNKSVMLYITLVTERYVKVLELRLFLLTDEFPVTIYVQINVRITRRIAWFFKVTEVTYFIDYNTTTRRIYFVFTAKIINL